MNRCDTFIKIFVICTLLFSPIAFCHFGYDEVGPLDGSPRALSLGKALCASGALFTGLTLTAWVLAMMDVGRDCGLCCSEPINRTSLDANNCTQAGLANGTGDVCPEADQSRCYWNGTYMTDAEPGECISPAWRIPVIGLGVPLAFVSFTGAAVGYFMLSDFFPPRV